MVMGMRLVGLRHLALGDTEPAVKLHGGIERLPR
jgi:hypothetical protein